MATKVTIKTTETVAVMSATPSGTPTLCSQIASGLAKMDSPTIPLSRPIEVMPIWMVERNWVGSSLMRKAAAADFLPFADMAESLARLEVKSATSDMARTPFTRIRENSRIISKDLFNSPQWLCER
jgi:hypothetical protein